MAATGSEKQGAKAYYVTTPIYYVNDAPHLGHAYTTVAGDVLTRWHRQRGEKVWYLTGTDEHGQKIMRTAEANGVTPQAWADKLVTEAWQPLWEHLDIANDDFIRTTQKRHTDRVQEFVQDLYDKGEIYKGGYEGPYCVGCEEYKLPGELLDGEGEYAARSCAPSTRSRWRSSARRTTSSSSASTARSSSRTTRPTRASSSPSPRATRS